MASGPSDVAQSVGQVVAAFDKAVNLVRRIEDRKDAKNDPESVRDLYKSLALGPIIVQGYFDADSKRLGPAYTIGDFTAQVQIRDVLLHLKTLVSDLQEVLLEETPTDFRQLQDVSDQCRVNAGVCLGQLSQRLMYNPHPPAYMSGVPPMASPVPTPGHPYPNMQSPHPQMGPRMPMTPEQLPQQDLQQQWDQKRPDANSPYFPRHHRQSTESSIQESFANLAVSGQYSDRNSDAQSIRRRSSHALPPGDGALLSPSLPADQSQAFPGQQDAVRKSYTSFDSESHLSRQSTQSSHQSRERFGPDDFGRDSQRPSAQPSQPSRERFGPDDFGAVDPRASRSRFGPDDYSDMQQQQQGSFAQDRNSTRSAASHASGSGMPFSPDHDFDARPAPLAPLRPGANRNVSQPGRQSLSSSVGPPPLGPVPNLPILQNDQGYHQSPTDQMQMQPPTFNESHRSPSQRSASVAVPYGAQPQRPLQPNPINRVLTSEQQRAQSVSVVQSPIVGTPTSASRAQSMQVGMSMPRPMPKSQPRVPLQLPTEKNPQAFCPRAVRLFLGQPKAIIDANRPVGMHGVLPYWRCSKCMFEGPMHTVPGPLDKKGRPGKPQKVFDPTARECGPMSTAIVGPDGRGEGSGGIRFKWSFLAKCHVPLKTIAEKQDGSAGGFCCIFCTTEGSARGWLAPTQTFNDAASTFSSMSGQSGSMSAGAGTLRVFGNFSSFMDHLQMHRREEMWPGEEMRDRMKCIVGRPAARGDDWEVNFLPLDP